MILRRPNQHSGKAWVSSLLFLLLFGTAVASAQSTNPEATQPPPSSVENSRVGEHGGSAPVEPLQRSRATGWFNRSGSGLFIALTPFATAMTLSVLLLLILLPFLFRIAYRRGKKGYFKTVYARQRRYA